MSRPIDIPTIDQLVADPGRVRDLPVPVVHHILIQLTALLPLLVAKSHNSPEKSPEDRLLSIEEAASILGMSKDRLYRKEYPFAIREGGLLRFSSNGIQKYIHARLHQR